MATDDQNVVHLRVQVIDLRSFTLDLQVPTFLPAKDVSQRVARDAGLEAFWPDGRRRLYWIRARGRLMAETERLADLGVVNGELVYLLPEPPAGSGVVEQVPEYPATRDYAGAGYPALFGSLAVVVAWGIAWGVLLAEDRTLLVTTLPGLALGLMCASLGRHTWGGRADRVRVAVTALFIQLTVSIIAFLSPMIAWYVPQLLHWPGAGVGEAPSILEVYRDGAPGIVLGMVGVIIGWLAWWGAAEPLPPREAIAQEQAAQQVVLPKCGICQQPVEAAVRHDCVHACGQVFHKGCHAAKQAVYYGPASRCAVCGKGVV